MSTTIELRHKPCCTSHGQDMSCERYRKTHFVEVRPCCEADMEDVRDGAMRNDISGSYVARASDIEGWEVEALAEAVEIFGVPKSCVVVERVPWDSSGISGAYLGKLNHSIPESLGGDKGCSACGRTWDHLGRITRRDTYDMRKVPTTVRGVVYGATADVLQGKAEACAIDGLGGVPLLCIHLKVSEPIEDTMGARDMRMSADFTARQSHAIVNGVCADCDRNFTGQDPNGDEA